MSSVAHQYWQQLDEAGPKRRLVMNFPHYGPHEFTVIIIITILIFCNVDYRFSIFNDRYLAELDQIKHYRNEAEVLRFQNYLQVRNCNNQNFTPRMQQFLNHYHSFFVRY